MNLDKCATILKWFLMIYKLIFGPFHSYIISFGLLDCNVIIHGKTMGNSYIFKVFVCWFLRFVFKWKLYFHVCSHFVVKGGHDEYENLKDLFIVDDEE
jgi:hypothetical protein